MLDKEEMAAFLSLLLAFAVATGLSGTRVAQLLDIGTPTMARWLRAAREGRDTMAYRYTAEPVIVCINLLNSRDEACQAIHGIGLYAGAASQPSRVRLATFKRVLIGQDV